MWVVFELLVEDVRLRPVWTLVSALLVEDVRLRPTPLH